MIISRTPFRISFFGGGTDYPIWYKKNKGAVLSTTINKYCYINCRYFPPFFKYKNSIAYSKFEHVDKIDDIEHPSVRECLRFINIKRGIEISHNADLPSRSGLGSSSSFTVGLLNALYALKGEITSKKQLALNAIHVEQDMIKENVGSQDQFAASFGGLNKIEFNTDQSINVIPITISKERKKYLQNHLLFFFTGFQRFASNIAKKQIQETTKKKSELTCMYNMVDESIKILFSDSTNIEDFGKLLHESWKIKRNLTDKISNPKIDQIYDSARNKGALGGKLIGAGGGGFMVFFAKPEFHNQIRENLKNLIEVPIQFENSGSRIIFYNPDVS